MTHRCVCAAALLSLITFPLAATHPPPPAVDRTVWDWVLLPIYAGAPAPGANGSLWTQRLTVYNGAQEVVLAAYPWHRDRGVALPARTTRQVTLDWAAAAVAPRLLWINDASTAATSFELRVLDLNAPEIPPVPIPVLRSRDFKTATLQLLDVPAGPHVRSTVRLYMVTKRMGGVFGGDSYVFAVRVFRPAPASPDVLEAERFVTFTLNHRDDLPVNSRDAAIPGLLTGLPPGNVRVEVEPIGHTEPFWAFVATVDNETGRLSVYTP